MRPIHYKYKGPAGGGGDEKCAAAPAEELSCPGREGRGEGGSEMRSGGGGRKRAGNGDAAVSLGIRSLDADGSTAGGGHQETVHAEAGEVAEASGGDRALGGGDEEEEGEGGEDSDEEEEGNVGGGEERPRLEDGFFEIEDIRKKRVRKGQLQYLIKWRGWPETANTWEPFDNVQFCADIIEAFEERRKGLRATRKRKRKSSGSLSVGRKKRLAGSKQRAGTGASSPSMVKTAAPNVHSETDDAQGSGAGEGTAIHAEKETSGADGEQIEKTDPSNKAPGPNSAEAGGGGPVSVDLRLADEDKPSKSGGRHSGARKRKSGSVRRFNQDASGHGSSQGLAGEKAENGDGVSRGAKDGDGLVKILRAVACAASIANDVQQVSITFVAQRSDGREVQVDNEFLKAHCPAMLINFYEQHLRFGST